MGSHTSETEPATQAPLRPAYNQQELANIAVIRERFTSPDEVDDDSGNRRPLLAQVQQHQSTSILLSEDHPSQCLPWSRHRP
jgi:hypothetical protein